MCQKESWEQSLRQRKPIPHRGANHRECTGLGCGGTSKWKSQINDHAERGVALIQEAAQSKRFENEEQLQYALQVIEQNRADFPDAKKSTVRRKLSLDQTNNSFKTDTTN